MGHTCKRDLQHAEDDHLEGADHLVSVKYGQLDHQIVICWEGEVTHDLDPDQWRDAAKHLETPELEVFSLVGFRPIVHPQPSNPEGKRR